MNKKNLFFVVLFMSMLLLPLGSSFMPESHVDMQRKALTQSPNSPVGLVVQNNFDDFIAGNILTDSSVFYYFSEGFTSIGKEYRATHSAVLCKRAVELASSQQELAFAYGICSHHVEDAVSHNVYVPMVIERSNLPNGLVHALAEEAVNDKIRTPELTAQVRNALLSKAPVHREFFIELLQSDHNMQDIDIGNLYDAFVDEVAGSSKYSVGFRSFTAVPTSIHVVLILMFLFSLFGSAVLIRRKKKNIFVKILVGFLIFQALLILIVYVLFLTNNLWKAFQTLSAPLTMLLPTSGWESSYNLAIQETVNLFNSGAVYVNGIKDPSGSMALEAASKAGSTIRILINILLVSFVGLFIYLGVKKNKRK